MQFQIYSIIQVRRTKVFTIYLLIVRMRKNHNVIQVRKLQEICRIKFTNAIIYVKTSILLVKNMKVMLKYL